MTSNPDQNKPAPANQEACGLLRLLLVMIYDSIVVLAILMIAAAIALELPFASQSAGKDPAYTLYLLLVWFFYLAWCWRHGGMTLGMRAWKVRLQNQLDQVSGQPPRWWQCGLRFVGAWLSALPVGLGYWWMLFDREHRSWHDRLSSTRLVHSRRYKQATREATQETGREQAATNSHASSRQEGSDAAPEEVNRSHPK